MEYNQAENCLRELEDVQDGSLDSIGLMSEQDFDHRVYGIAVDHWNFDTSELGKLVELAERHKASLEIHSIEGARVKVRLF